MPDKVSSTEQGKALIDKAAEMCGSRYALAKRLDVDEAMLSKMARGKLSIGPRLAARLAAVAGYDPRESALAALVDQEKDDAARAELVTLFRLGHHVMATVLAVLAVAVMSVIPTGQAEARVNADSHAKQGFELARFEKVPFRQHTRP